VLRANPKRCDPIELTEIRRWAHGYQCKFGVEPNPLPPNDLICAQILAAATVHQFAGLVQDMQAQRIPPGASPPWWVSVVLDKIHGIRAVEVKQARADLRAVRKRGNEIPPVTGEQQQFPAPEGLDALQKHVENDPNLSSDYAQRMLREIAEKKLARKAKGA
jgi:hypothetical protein